MALTNGEDVDRALMKEARDLVRRVEDHGAPFEGRWQPLLRSVDRWVRAAFLLLLALMFGFFAVFVSTPFFIYAAVVSGAGALWALVSAGRRD